jgi:transcription termination/antitermination protein NusG
MNIVTPWYVLQTRPQHEKQVERLLTQKGYECLLPTYRRKRRWSDRVVESDLPLFPSYIFCRFNSDVMGKAISTPGVSRIVGFGGKPGEIELDEIEALRLLSKSDVLREPWAFIPQGSKIQVETGPLAGVKGVICPGPDKSRLVISIMLLQRSTAVILDEDTVISVFGESKKMKPWSSTRDSQSSLALNLLEQARGYAV